MNSVFADICRLGTLISYSLYESDANDLLKCVMLFIASTRINKNNYEIL